MSILVQPWGFAEGNPSVTHSLGRDGLPSETLKRGSSDGDSSGDGAKIRFLKGIDSSAHLSKVPLQVLSGETTPALRVLFLIVTEG